MVTFRTSNLFAMYLVRLALCSVIALCSVHVASAQPGAKYSIQDKKAIKFYEEAVGAYEIRLVDEAMYAIERAIDRDARFSEAYLLRAQIYADANKRDRAIADLETVTQIGAEGFNEIYFYLGELLMQEGAYPRAKSAFVAFAQKGSRDVKLVEHAALLIRSCDFAVEAMKHPVDFNPINLGPGVNTAAPEYFPCLTADNKTLLFTRLVNDQRVRGGKQEDFFMSTKVDGVWQEAQPIREINTPFNEGAPTLSADGQWLIFTACEAAGGDWGPYRGKGSCDLFASRLVGDKWSEPINIAQINSYDWESQPSFSADGKTLYFVRGKSTGRGIKKQDIYYTELQADGSWTKPQPIPGKVNTPFEEESVMIHPDGETLFFSSNGHPGMGGLDIFYSKKQPDGTWGEPVNLGYPINTGGDENSLLVSADGTTAYFASDRAGGFGNLDLYSFELPEAIRPQPVSFVNGEVFDAASFRKLEARLELIDLETGQVVVEGYSNPGNGQFLVVLPPGRDYALNVARSGYLFYSENFSLKGVKAGEPVSLEVPLEKLREGSMVVLNNVFFDTDSYELKPSSRAELDKLAELLLANRGVKVEIGGHTDSVGGEADNQVLSERRAGAVVTYLEEKGIEAHRLTSKGYGESKPVATNETAEGRAKNRRTEMKITEVR